MLNILRVRLTRAATRSVMRLFLLGVFCITASACSVQRGYSLMDWAMLWKIESYVDLEGEQKVEAKVALQQFEDWHQSTQLRQYADYLQSLQTRLNQGPVDAAFIHGETDKIQLFIDQSFDRLLPDVARIAATLTDAQVAELIENLHERRQKFEKEYVDLPTQKQVKKRYEKLKDHLDNWLGGLSREQKGWLANWALSLEPYEATTAQQQRKLAEDLQAILKERDNAQKLMADLRSVAVHRSDGWGEEVEAMIDRNQEKTYSVIAKILNNLSGKQKAHLNKKLSGYIEDMRALAPPEKNMSAGLQG